MSVMIDEVVLEAAMLAVKWRITVGARACVWLVAARLACKLRETKAEVCEVEEPASMIAVSLRVTAMFAVAEETVMLDWRA